MLKRARKLPVSSGNLFGLSRDNSFCGILVNTETLGIIGGNLGYQLSDSLFCSLSDKFLKHTIIAQDTDSAFRFCSSHNVKYIILSNCVFTLFFCFLFGVPTAFLNFNKDNPFPNTLIDLK